MTDLTLSGWELMRHKLAAALEGGVIQEALALLPGMQRALQAVTDGGGESRPIAQVTGAIVEALESAKTSLPGLLARLTKGVASGVDLEVMRHCLECEKDADLNLLTAREFMALRTMALEVNDVAELVLMEKNFWAGLIGNLLPRAQAGSEDSSRSADSTG